MMEYVFLVGIFFVMFDFSILHYFGKTLCTMCSPIHQKLISLGAGVVMTYVFVYLLPQAKTLLDYFFVLGGFVLFLFLETFIYKHSPKMALNRRLQFLHEGMIFVVHFLAGVLLFYAAQSSFKDALFFFIPFLVVAISEDFSLHFLHGSGSESVSSQFITSFAFFVGIVGAALIDISHGLIGPVHGIVAGALLFIVTNEIMHKEKKRNPGFVVLGIALFSVLVIVAV